VKLNKNCIARVILFFGLVVSAGSAVAQSQLDGPIPMPPIPGAHVAGLQR